MATLYECTTCGGKVSENAKVCPHCGEDGGAGQAHAEEFVNSESKSRITSFILTLLLGPLGLLYSSVVWGIVLTVIAIVGAVTIAVPVFIWFLSIIMGDSFTHNYNKKIKSKANLI